MITESLLSRIFKRDKELASLEDLSDETGIRLTRLKSYVEQQINYLEKVCKEKLSKYTTNKVNKIDLQIFYYSKTNTYEISIAFIVPINLISVYIVWSWIQIVKKKNRAEVKLLDQYSLWKSNANGTQALIEEGSLKDDPFSSLSFYKKFNETIIEPETKIDETEMKFVIHKHEPRSGSLHYDLRFMDLKDKNNLLSFAFGKDFPQKYDKKIVGVRTRDHDKRWLDLKSYRLEVFDQGTVRITKYYKKYIELSFNGEKIKGGYLLFSIKTRRGDNWMLIRKRI